MSIGEVLHDYRKQAGMTQEEFADRVLIDRSSVAKVENGKRPAPSSLIRQAASTFDDPRLYLAAQEEITGGASVPWLDNADLHRAATHLKSMEETEEAIAAMKTAPIMKRPDQLTVADRAAIRTAIFECVEAITALTHNVAVLCKDYAFSYIGIWKEHRAELKSKKYLN
ncbi:helix-turn-helix domain-containing protein [Paenibacillus chibensis]|uniref:helix-turn-helix domain-containing protein n=1 Tax=Paenibacillus chibensis TaxID=59846 RepID=UPI000FDA45E6|nr:helix-turn-helix transcriptional regulator [Paenibacillus chibensis]MEC0370856.1 helix-turn-helix transcriptional regulator [Paenibacillus chibensis]